MSVSETPLPAATAPSAARAAVRRLWFWIRRYGAAELVGTAAILATAAPLHAGGAPIPVVAGVAVVAESIGFYGVMAAAVYRELRRGAARLERGPAVRRALALLLAEFGPAEAFDSLLIRPGMVALALLLLDGSGALVMGKIAADLAFYALAAAAFTLTRRLGWRSARVDD